MILVKAALANGILGNVLTHSWAGDAQRPGRAIRKATSAPGLFDFDHFRSAWATPVSGMPSTSRTVMTFDKHASSTRRRSSLTNETAALDQ